nr:AlNc14C25G2473 [Albugo laibachii Nc14]|eukprot:CCA16718.1 AlNc14C25G2473 [Albugo laibachii Nc14]
MTTEVRDWRGNIKTLDARVVAQVEDEETKPQDNVQVEYMKDEFGRDVVVPKSSNKEKERKHKKSTKRKDKKSKKAAFNGTPPPADPFRPELDESRTGRR